MYRLPDSTAARAAYRGQQDPLALRLVQARKERGHPFGCECMTLSLDITKTHTFDPAVVGGGPISRNILKCLPLSACASACAVQPQALHGINNYVAS